MPDFSEDLVLKALVKAINLVSRIYLFSSLLLKVICASPCGPLIQSFQLIFKSQSSYHCRKTVRIRLIPIKGCIKCRLVVCFSVGLKLSRNLSPSCILSSIQAVISCGQRLNLPHLNLMPQVILFTKSLRFLMICFD